MICFYGITPKTCGFCLKWVVIQPHTITSSGFTAILRNTLNFINYSWKWRQHFRLFEKMWMSHKLWYTRNASIAKLEKIFFVENLHDDQCFQVVIRPTIHGCIDGFSRKAMWLVVSTTNNDLLLVGNLYLNCIKEYKVVPKSLRVDAETENM